MRWVSAAGLSFVLGGISAAEVKNPLDAWRTGVEIRPVLGADATSHSIHTYFNANPESPDGRQVLFFRSSDPKAHLGDICILDRESGAVRVIALNVETEDAHRAACQQWALGGEAVVFHAWRNEKWFIGKVDLENDVLAWLAPGRQLGFCQPESEWVPICGAHSNPEGRRHLELLNLHNGQVSTAVSIDSVRPAWAETGYAEYLDKEFGDKPISICFPMISPDGKRIYFKLAMPGMTKDFRSPLASRRLGIFSYDLEEKRYLFFHGKWGHPAWHPGSRHIINMWGNGPVLIDLESGKVEKQMPMPDFLKSGGHPSISPDGKLFVTDGRIAGDKNRWGVALGDFESGEWHLLMKFDNSNGAASWRKNHPHPVFSADGKRIYFNVNSGKWTRLHVAECRADQTGLSE